MLRGALDLLLLPRPILQPPEAFSVVALVLADLRVSRAVAACLATTALSLAARLPRIALRAAAAQDFMSVHLSGNKGNY